MGIRFFCPQGHKLNVKSFLAGKIGVCPHCDARVKIPRTSTRPSSKAINRDGGGHQEALPLASPLEDLDEVLAIAEVIPVPESAKPPQAPPNATSDHDQKSPLAQSASDFFSESPNAKWFVCPEPGGENYGPANGELMRKWLREGRVLADHLVWREGWDDWQRAGDCFAYLELPFKPGEFNGPSSQ